MPQPKGVLKHALEEQERRKRRPLPNNGKGRPKGARCHVTAELVEQELAAIAFFDPLGLFERMASVGGAAPIFTLRELSAMPRSVRVCIASIKVRNENLTSGDGHRDQTIEVKFWDKIKALEMCAKHLGYIDGKSGNITAKELLTFLEEGRRRNANRVAALVRQELPAAVDAETVDSVPVSVDDAGNPEVMDLGDVESDDIVI